MERIERINFSNCTLHGKAIKLFLVLRNGHKVDVPWCFLFSEGTAILVVVKFAMMYYPMLCHDRSPGSFPLDSNVAQKRVKSPDVASILAFPASTEARMNTRMCVCVCMYTSLGSHGGQQVHKRTHTACTYASMQIHSRQPG